MKNVLDLLVSPVSNSGNGTSGQYAPLHSNRDCRRRIQHSTSHSENSVSTAEGRQNVQDLDLK